MSSDIITIKDNIIDDNIFKGMLNNNFYSPRPQKKDFINKEKIISNIYKKQKLDNNLVTISEKL